jgi:poly(A) polymerase
LLGKVPKDFDVATDATPEQVKKVFPRARLIGRRFRIAHVRMSGSLIEVATFRGHHSDGQGKSDSANGRILRDNVFGSLEEDALRRDFTINALFMDPVSGDIRDYVNGFEDLENAAVAGGAICGQAGRPAGAGNRGNDTEARTVAGGRTRSAFV